MISIHDMNFKIIYLKKLSHAPGTDVLTQLFSSCTRKHENLIVFYVNSRHWNDALWHLREYYGSWNGRTLDMNSKGWDAFPFWMIYFCLKTSTVSKKYPSVTQKWMLMPVKMSEALTLQTKYLYWTNEQDGQRQMTCALFFCNLRNFRAN